MPYFCAKSHNIGIFMKHKIFLSLCLCCMRSQAQTVRTLSHYIECAAQNSPLIADCHNQAAIQEAELARLKAFYTHSTLEVNGEYQFVPIVSRDNGKTSFQLNAQSGTDYYGYDLGESSGHAHAGVTWTQPLLGGKAYKTAQEQTKISNAIASNRIVLEKHQLERTVTEQYLLCLLDKAQISVADSIDALIAHQQGIVARLAKAGLSKQSDLQLLGIERKANEELRTSLQQSYATHLYDLNILCGITDTAGIALADARIAMRPTLGNAQSAFCEQFRLDSLSAEAALRTFNLQYRPRLDIFVNAGLQTGAFTNFYKHLGWSAGLTFSWIISDGRQRQSKARQVSLQQSTINAYQTHAERQRAQRVSQCLAEIAAYGKREASIRSQITGYDNVLANYSKEIASGQMSVLDYITVLRRKVKAENDLLLLQTNRQLATTAYNYWNW